MASSSITERPKTLSNAKETTENPRTHSVDLHDHATIRAIMPGWNAAIMHTPLSKQGGAPTHGFQTTRGRNPNREATLCTQIKATNASTTQETRTPTCPTPRLAKTCVKKHIQPKQARPGVRFGTTMDRSGSIAPFVSLYHIIKCKTLVQTPRTTPSQTNHTNAHSRRPQHPSFTSTPRRRTPSETSRTGWPRTTRGTQVRSRQNTHTKTGTANRLDVYTR